MEDSFLIGIKYFHDSGSIFSLIKMIPNSKRFEIFIAIELLVVVIRHFHKSSLIFRIKDRDSITTKV